MNENLKARLGIVIEILEEKSRPGTATVRELMAEHEGLERSLESTQHTVDALHGHLSAERDNAFQDAAALAAMKARAEKAEAEAEIRGLEVEKEMERLRANENKYTNVELKTAYEQFNLIVQRLDRELLARYEKIEAENATLTTRAEKAEANLAEEKRHHAYDVEGLAQSCKDRLEATIRAEKAEKENAELKARIEGGGK